ncbi:cytokine-inducible SH2-containing protein-like [Aedes albopictus]|uniref:SH2 domain-containing protein n=1 Tax=Aedes albopictus TaxID=7160 RepID=A0ABM1XVI6_AEDAL
MDEQRQSENIYRFKWFMSLARKRSRKPEKTSKQHQAPAKMTHSSGVFFTLRKRFQNLTSVNVEAYEPEQFASDGERKQMAEFPNTRSENDFVRIVLERHSQNPIRFSSPNVNLPVISLCGVQPMPIQVQPEFRNVCCIERINVSDNLETMMDKVRTDLLKYGWYWGKLTRSSAQKRLARQDNGTFLVRDSETEKHKFSISFRSSGITLHCRIDYKDNSW